MNYRIPLPLAIIFALSGVLAFVLVGDMLNNQQGILITSIIALLSIWAMLCEERREKDNQIIDLKNQLLKLGDNYRYVSKQLANSRDTLNLYKIKDAAGQSSSISPIKSEMAEEKRETRFSRLKRNRAKE